MHRIVIDVASFQIIDRVIRNRTHKIEWRIRYSLQPINVSTGRILDVVRKISARLVLVARY